MVASGDKNGDKSGKDEAPGEATQIGGAPPPMPPPAPPAAAPPPRADSPQADKGAADATQVGGAAPNTPPPAAPNPDATQVGGAAPPPPVLNAPPPAAPTAKPTPAEPAASAGATVVAGTGEATVIAGGEATVIAGGEATVVGGGAADATMIAGGAVQIAPTTQLERLAPPEHRGEIVVLDPARNEYQVGRHEACDVRLYSPIASRQHARLVAEPDGTWVLRPAAGKPVKAGRKQVEADLPLTNGMRITLGDDAFKVVAEQRGPTAAGAGSPLAGIDRTQLVLFGVIGVLLVAIVAVLVMR